MSGGHGFIQPSHKSWGRGAPATEEHESAISKEFCNLQNRCCTYRLEIYKFAVYNHNITFCTYDYLIISFNNRELKFQYNPRRSFILRNVSFMNLKIFIYFLRVVAIIYHT